MDAVVVLKLLSRLDPFLIIVVIRPAGRKTEFALASVKIISM